MNFESPFRSIKVEFSPKEAALRICSFAKSLGLQNGEVRILDRSAMSVLLDRKTAYAIFSLSESVSILDIANEYYLKVATEIQKYGYVLGTMYVNSGNEKGTLMYFTVMKSVGAMVPLTKFDVVKL